MVFKVAWALHEKTNSQSPWQASNAKTANLSVGVHLVAGHQGKDTSKRQQGKEDFQGDGARLVKLGMIWDRFGAIS